MMQGMMNCGLVDGWLMGGIGLLVLLLLLLVVAALVKVLFFGNRRDADVRR